MRRADRTSHPSPLSRDPYRTLISNAVELPRWKRGSFSLRLLERKQPRSKTPSAVSSELGSVVALSERDSAWEQVQAIRGHSKQRCVKANKAPCVVAARRTVCGRQHFEEDASEAQKSARAELPRAGGEEPGQAVLANAQTR